MPIILTLSLHRRAAALALAVFLFSTVANAQFKEIKEAPFSPAVARQKIGALLQNVAPANRDQTLAKISSWLDWYRDILDDELIARWKGDSRANLPQVMAPLADARVASQVVDFSWRQQRQETFNLTYAPVLGDLMARYPDSAKPFLSDLAAPIQLSPTEAEAVCRILLDMPDIGTWRKSALQILPQFRQVADNLLKQDLNGHDQEKMYRALRWRSDLRLDPPAVTGQKLTARNNPPSLAATPPRPHIVGQPSPQPYTGAPYTGTPYTGPMSGTLESAGGPIPPNGEYVFPGVPPVKLLLDFDTKNWEARLEPGEGQTQVLVLRNIGKGSRKRCVVHWSVMP